MMTKSDAISKAFNALSWHDSKLNALRIVRQEDTDDIVLEVELRRLSGQELTPATITFKDVAFLIADLDLHGKRECSDDISSATCSAESELKEKFVQDRLKYSPTALDGYFHFSFYLIPPGGSVDILAASFVLETHQM